MRHPHKPDLSSRMLGLEKTGRRRCGFFNGIGTCLHINRDDLAAISCFYQGAYLPLRDIIP